jgi:hypothetical protein
VQQKHWNLVVRQQERGEKKDQGAGEGVRDQGEHFQQTQLLEQQSIVSVSGLEKNVRNARLLDLYHIG